MTKAQIKSYSPEILKQKLGKVFKSFGGVSLVYLFGSQVTGKTGVMSDLDIGILWDEKEKAVMIKSCEIGNKIADILKDENIQVVPLNEQGLSFCFNVIKFGICIFGNESKRVRYETSILNQYLDFQYFASQYNQSFSGHILGK
jgi:predicted nucleotidyltransferase